MSVAQHSRAAKRGAMTLLVLLSAGCSPLLDDLYIDDVDCEPTPNSRSGADIETQRHVAQSTATSIVPRTQAENAVSTEPVRFASSALDEAFRPVAAPSSGPATAVRTAAAQRMHE